jgi:leucyl aminopeptidase
MEFSTKTVDLTGVRADCVAVGIHAAGEMTAAARRLDSASGGAVRAAIKSGEMTGQRGTTLMLRAATGITSPRLLLVGLGKPGEAVERGFAEAVRAMVKAAGPIRTLVVDCQDWTPPSRDARWRAAQLALSARETTVRTDELKSRRDPEPRLPAQIVVAVDRREETASARGLAHGRAIANGSDLARRLGNLPANICTPTFLAAEARKLAREFGLVAQILQQRQIEALRMDSFLSVARGSDEPPRLIVLRYNGGRRAAAPIALVGKGITFDSGGISIKPAAAMDEMKYDMCGAAAVLGTLRAAAELKLAVNIVGVIPACENMPSGRANKPGDIVTSMSGQTIEILNTDAEGRLILCDALTFVGRFKPAAVIDIATLTGACVVALGNVNSGLFSPDDELAAQLAAAGRRHGDYAWRLPLDDEYQEQLKSNFADLANIGAPPNAGAVTAACFLSRFTKSYRWAHLDVAGTAWRSGANKGATGRPVPLLTEYLAALAG